MFPVNPDLEGPDQCDAAGWYGEETLDVEAVHAMAPGANIVYVGGSDCQDVVARQGAQQGHLQAPGPDRAATPTATSVRTSPPTRWPRSRTSPSRACSQGIGVYFSSGDSGDEVANLGYAVARLLGVEPVGHRGRRHDASASAQNGSKVLETGWETGKSTLDDGTCGARRLPAPSSTARAAAPAGCSPQPCYQQGVVPDALATKNQTPGAQGSGRARHLDGR